MPGLKIKLMGFSLKGELLSTDRILRTWFLWRTLYVAAYSLQCVILSAEDWAFYRELRLGMLRQLICDLENTEEE